MILLFQVVIPRFLRINDPELADDYSLKKIPCLVFFRWVLNSTNREMSSQLLLLSLQEWDSCGLRWGAQGRAGNVGMVGQDIIWLICLPVLVPSFQRLIKNQSSADDDDTIEETNEERLEIMVDNMITLRELHSYTYFIRSWVALSFKVSQSVSP